MEHVAKAQSQKEDVCAESISLSSGILSMGICNLKWRGKLKSHPRHSDICWSSATPGNGIIISGGPNTQQKANGVLILTIPKEF